MNMNITNIYAPTRHGNDPWWIVKYRKNDSILSKAFFRVEQAWGFYNNIAKTPSQNCR